MTKFSILRVWSYHLAISAKRTPYFCYRWISQICMYTRTCGINKSKVNQIINKDLIAKCCNSQLMVCQDIYLTPYPLYNRYLPTQYCRWLCKGVAILSYGKKCRYVMNQVFQSHAHETCCRHGIALRHIKTRVEISSFTSTEIGHEKARKAFKVFESYWIKLKDIKLRRSNYSPLSSHVLQYLNCLFVTHWWTRDDWSHLASYLQYVIY